MLADQIKRRGHQGEGFIFAVFSLPQARDRFRVQGIAGEVKSADAFDSDYLSGKQ